MATLLTAIFMPFITYLYKMNQTRISVTDSVQLKTLPTTFGKFWKILTC